MFTVTGSNDTVFCHKATTTPRGQAMAQVHFICFVSNGVCSPVPAEVRQAASAFSAAPLSVTFCKESKFQSDFVQIHVLSKIKSVHMTVFADILCLI